MRALVLIVFLACLLNGCAVFAPSPLSANYALEKGAAAEWHWKDTVQPAPALIDGDLKTEGETSREIQIRLPSPRSIHKVRVLGSNYKDAVLYIGGRGDGNWKMVGRVDENRSGVIEWTFKSSRADRIRLRISNTADDRLSAGKLIPGKPIAAEIEIYGFQSGK